MSGSANSSPTSRTWEIGPTNEAIWDMEDEPLLEAIWRQIADLSHRQAGVA